MDATAPAPLILVTVGTDHHPFDRLIRWVDDWLAAGGADRARVLIQSGTSARPVRASWTAYLPHLELIRALEEAVAVVCHGGPGTIMHARAAGRLPIVLPRRRELGEHVDDHQVRFCDRLADEEAIALVHTEGELHGLLDRALEDSDAFRAREPNGHVARAAARFGELVDGLVHSPPAPGGPSSGAAPASGPPVRVLYIGGTGRSGSTLLDRVLGQVPGFVSAGELVHLWQRGLVEDQLCGCGQSFRRCAFWTEVGSRAFGGWDELDVRDVLALQHAVDRNRRIPQMLAPTGAYAARLRRYTRILAQLYAGIRDASGADVVIDSSKHASSAFLLRQIPGVDPRILHLVRDARGVAFSWAKTVPRPEIVDRTEYMPTPGAAKAAADWLAYNGLFEMLRVTGVKARFMRYEAFVEQPRARVRDVLALAGYPDAPLDFIGEGSVDLGPAHTVSGNPMRFRTGPTELRTDEEWKRRMDPTQRRVVAAIAFPLLTRYGYPTRVAPDHALGA